MAKMRELLCNDCPECRGCWRKNPVTIYRCDDCGTADEDLYEFDGQQLCGDCVLRRLEKVRQEDC